MLQSACTNKLMRLLGSRDQEIVDYSPIRVLAIGDREIMPLRGFFQQLNGTGFPISLAARHRLCQAVKVSFAFVALNMRPDIRMIVMALAGDIVDGLHREKK